MPPSFLSAIKPVEHPVNGSLLQFYPLSVGELFRIKDLLKPIARSLAVLLGKNDGDRGGFSHSEFEPATDRAKVFERSETPVSLEIARFRSEERSSAAATIIDAITSRENGRAIARVVMDSLRVEYPKRPIDDAGCAELYEALDVVTLRELLIGVGKANADVLGPFRGKVEEALRTTTADQNGAVPTEATAMVG